MVVFSDKIFNEFESHSLAVRKRARERQDAVQLRATVDDTNAAAVVDIRDTLGVKLPEDKWEGCTNLRTLRTLLSMIDDRGFERSPHQMAFHSSFERCVSRVIYKKDWSTSRPAIMRHNKWDKCCSEVLISTPRRFGKTFSIAIFAACMALSFGCEIVVFSPARRASRKLLERMVEFIRLLDCDSNIVEFNQEQCRVTSHNGKTSLIRSFPSKVGESIGRREPNLPTGRPRVNMSGLDAAVEMYWVKTAGLYPTYTHMDFSLANTYNSSIAAEYGEAQHALMKDLFDSKCDAEKMHAVAEIIGEHRNVNAMVSVFYGFLHGMGVAYSTSGWTAGHQASIAIEEVRCKLALAWDGINGFQMNFVM